MVVFSFSLMVITATFSIADAQVGPCRGRTAELTATENGGTIYSNGYPDQYHKLVSQHIGKPFVGHHINQALHRRVNPDRCLKAYAQSLCTDSCAWLLSTLSSSEVVQIETLDIDVEQVQGTCMDFIAAYDGDSDQSPLLKKWCGTEKAVVQSTGQKMFLKFVSNPSATRKGFSIRYHAITPHNLTCAEGPPNTFPVGTAPVHYQFYIHETRVSLCHWVFEAEGSRRLALTFVESTGYVECDKGYFAVYDGVNTSAPEIVRWCNTQSAGFSTIYPTGPVLVMVFMYSRLQDNFEFHLKAETRPAQETCDDTQMPVLTVKKSDNPVFMALPYATTAEGASCPVQFRNLESDYFRIDVLKVDGRDASCDSSAVEVNNLKEVPSQSVNSECLNGMQPVYLPHSSQITVKPVPGSTSIIQVVANDYRCSGFVWKETTFRNRILKYSIPRSSDSRYSKFCVSRVLFTPDEEGDHPLIEVAGDVTSPFGNNFIRVYNGSSTNDAVIFELNNTRSFYDKRVVGPGREMLFEFISNSAIGIGFINIRFWSVPVTKICEERVIVLNATSIPQNLTSVNYPGYFPISFYCRYVINTEAEGEVVHVKVLDSDFSPHCAHQLSIYDGDRRVSFGTKMGMVCKGNPDSQTKFESTGGAMTITFSSDDSVVSKGWKLQYYSGPPSAPEALDDDDDNAATIVGAVLGVIILILIIVIICIVVRNRRSGSASI